ncbi:MAG: DnaD domain protein [Butyrivibrio sp.]|nr:DnaD domain protein [Butyrivibrio sp.]
MGRVTINQNTGVSSTSVSNIFIDEYLGEANDAQIKIYLYLLRMMSANLPTSVSDLADKFNHTEKDVLRSLRYWEKLGLISLEYDESGLLTSVHMEDVVPHKTIKKRKETSPVQETIMEAPAKIAPIRQISMPASTTPVKPAYTADQLESFQQDVNLSPLLFIAEQYFGRTLNPTEMTTILYIHDELHFSADLIDFLMQYCVDHHKKDFRYMEKVAINWAEMGITTPKQARQQTYKYDESVLDIMKALGMENAPTDKEVSYISRWQGEYSFSMPIIMEACDRTVMSTQRNRLKYCDSILRNWYENNVKTKSDITRLDANFSSNIARERNNKKVSSIDMKNRFNQFQQSTAYDFDELEKQLLDN